MKQGNHTLSWLWRLSAGNRGKMISMTLMQMLLGMAAVASAWLLRGLIDCAADGDFPGFRQYGLSFVGLILGQLILRAVYRRLEEVCQASLENRMKSRLFGVLLSRDHASVGAVHSGEWMNRLTSDTAFVAAGLTAIVPGVCGMAVRLLGALGLLMGLLPWLAEMILAGGLLLLLLTWLFRRQLKSLHRQVQEADGNLRSFLTERLSALLVLRAFGRQKTAQAEAEAFMEAHKQTRMRKNTFSNLCNLGFGLATRGAYVLGALLCGYGILTGVVSYGTFTAVLQLINQVQNPFANLSGFVPRFYATVASAERLMEAERFPPDCPQGIMSQEEAQTVYQDLQAIVFRDVSFSYSGDGTAALVHQNLFLEKGKYIAFTGHSGCGKSTALKLLLALYEADSGERLLLTHQGEKPLTAWYRSLFAYVPQGNVLMSGTVRQVVTFDDKDTEEAAIWQALEIACADGFVRQLEQGLDTVLGERGAGLSEGQLQRLAIARAVVSGRPIVLLDEATSALDETTEAAVLQNLRRLTDKTVLIVTHRPGALAVCDEEVSFE